MARDGRIGFLKCCPLPLLVVLLSSWVWAVGTQAQSRDALGGKNVLILHALEANMPLNVRTDRAIMASLETGGVGLKNQFYEYLDLHRHPSAKHLQVLAEMLRVRHGNRKIDAIITLYPEALQFVLDEGRTIFPDAPIVALYMYPGFEAPKAGRRIVQHVLRNDIAGTLESALKLVPQAKSVYVVSGVHPLDKKNEAQARLDLQKWQGRLDVRYVTNMSLDEMVAVISGAPRDTIILYLAVSADNTGQTYNPRDVAERLSQVANGPVFGVYESILGYGIAGGSLVSYDSIGTQAGQLALGFLQNGSDPNTIPAILDLPAVLKFDWRQLKRWNLSVAAVPPGSININREYTLWEQYGTAVIVAFFVLVVQALLIVILAVNRAQRQRAERQLARQLRIETLLTELSASFVHLPANQIEGKIQDAQRRICELLDLDRSTLWQVPENEPATLRLTHVHTPEGTAPVPSRMDMRDFFPWGFRMIMRGEMLTLSTLAALPSEAARDRETFERYGTKSVVVVPLFAGGDVFGALTFTTVRAERQWSDDVVKGFRMVAEVMANALARKRAEEALESRLRFESLLSELSARFVNLRSDQIDSTIEDAQRRVCEFLDLDLAVLWQWSVAGTGILRATHVYAREGLQAPKEMRQEHFPWYVQQMLAGRSVAISSLEDLPAEAALDRETCRLIGVKSNLSLPLMVGGTPPIGLLGFNTLRAECDWPDAAVTRLQLIAQVFTNALVRMRSDDALRESQARLTLAAASADARLWELDPNSARVWMTEEGRAFYGATSAEALTLDQVASSIHPDDRESWRQSIQQALESGQPMRNEFRVIRADGTIRWFVSKGRSHVRRDGESPCLLGVSIDITDRRQVEDRLRTSEALSSGVLASLPGHIAIVDRAGSVLRTSDAWPAFAAGEGALDPTVLAVGAGRPHARPRAVEHAGPVVTEIQEGIAAVLTGTQTEFRFDYAYPTRTEERWASVSVLPLQRPEGGAVIYCQDITAQQRSRLEAERLRRELTHVGRVTTMGEMAAALAHELNQPLTAILSNAHAGERYLAQGAPPLGEIREILQDVAGDARRAGEVIQRLRSLLRKDEARFLPLDINQVVREVATLVHTDAILRNLALALDLAPTLPPVRGDRVQLQQVLLNLVLNGMEAARPESEERRLVIQTRSTGAAVQVAVRDQGPGIPAETLPRLFETFYTTKPNGLGMGLPISRSIVEAHGGRIWAANNPDRGATFSFTLPACPPEAAPA